MKLNRKIVGSVKLGQLLATGFFLVSAMAWAQNAPNLPAVLKRDRPITKFMAGKDRHAYTVNLKKGMYLDVAVKQHDIDVITEVFGPDSVSLGKFDAPTSERGTERARIGAEAAGEYRIEVFT